MHVWDLSLGKHPWLCGAPLPHFRYGDYSAIRKDYSLSNYRSDAAGLPIAATVYVEAEWDPADPIGETRWVHEVAAQRGMIAAMVAQAWLDREDAGEVIAAQAAFDLVRSVRHKPASAPTPTAGTRGAPGSMDDPRWRDGYAHLARHGLHFDLQTPSWHLDAALELARDVPHTLIILNHTGLPADRSPEGLRAWRNALEGFADAPNTAIKISGLGVPGSAWETTGNDAIVRTALDIFGVERAMFASNFPVDSLVASMAGVFDGFADAVAHLNRADRAALFRTNACRIYGIDPAAVTKEDDEREDER